VTAHDLYVMLHEYDERSWAGLHCVCTKDDPWPVSDIQLMVDVMVVVVVVVA
jgi:hypothetical protein